MSRILVDSGDVESYGMSVVDIDKEGAGIGSNCNTIKKDSNNNNNNNNKLGFYRKLKNRITKRFRRDNNNNNDMNSGNTNTNSYNYNDNSNESTTGFSGSSMSNNIDDSNIIINNYSTRIRGRLYYYNNGQYFDNNLNEYQLSIPRTRDSNMTMIVSPNWNTIPIRIDPPVTLEQESVNRLSTTTREHPPSLFADVGSSSLNLSDESSTEDSSTQLTSSSTEDNSSPSPSSDAVSSMEFEDGSFEEGFTETVTGLTRTITQAATLVAPNTTTSRSTQSPSLSPSSSSYNSLLQSPEYLYKRTQSA